MSLLWRHQLRSLSCTLSIRWCNALLFVASLESFLCRMVGNPSISSDIDVHRQAFRKGHLLQGEHCSTNAASLFTLRQRSSPEVRMQVLQRFKPPREGEEDYSALLISFCRKMKQQQDQQMLQNRMPPNMPVAPQVQFQPVMQTFPQRVPQQQPSRPTFRGDNANNYALEGFRQRYPMDDRAFDFLKNAPPSIQSEILERFAPQREDTDFSALIIGFAKKCREAQRAAPMLAKRPRLFWGAFAFAC